MKVNYMKNAKKQKSLVQSTIVDAIKILDAKTNETTVVEKIMTVADVARELNIDPKNARSFLRKNVELYTMRKTKFTQSSSLYEQCKNALLAYKNKNKIVTQ